MLEVTTRGELAVRPEVLLLQHLAHRVSLVQPYFGL
jgi:hypothetical protein